MKLQEPYRSTIVQVLSEQKKQHEWYRHASRELQEVHDALRTPESREIFLIADLCGVPKDNCAETNACDRANETGEWPDDAYCRDWLFDTFYALPDSSTETISEWLSELEEEGESEIIREAYRIELGDFAP